MIGFIHFSDTLRKASKNKLLQIVNLLDIVSKGTKKELYLRIISELGIIYDKNNYDDIEKVNKKIFDILNSWSLIEAKFVKKFFIIKY